MIHRFRKHGRQKQPLRSYAQSGEDILAYRVLCGHLRIDRPTYVDIGAHDPVHLSNTYLLYTLGSNGLLIEPDPDCVKKLRRKRRRDTVLAAGISPDIYGEAPFYRLNQPTLNTFSWHDAQDACTQGPYRVIEEMRVPVVPIADAIDAKHAGRPNFLSIDAEGLDVAILSSYDFERHAPELICVESAEFCEDNLGPLRDEIFNLLDERGYFLYASTYLNGLFVQRKAWRDHVGRPPARTLRPPQEQTITRTPKNAA
ncbi:MAG: FkbM family methyltransferase [Planctomycetota bacterium]